MKIAIIYSTGYPPEEGIGTYVWNLSKSLRDLGHEVTLITRGNGKTHTQDQVSIHETKYYPVYPFHSYLHRIFVNKVISKNNFDILNVHSPLCLPPKTDQPLVSTVHTPIETSAKLSSIYGFRNVVEQLTARTISKRVEKKLINDSRLVTGVSPSVCQILNSKYSIFAESLPNAIDPEEFIPSDQTDDYYLYVGRLAPRKGVTNLIEAFDRLSAQLDDIELRIVGRGPLEENVKQMVTERGLSPVIKFEGFVSDAQLKQLYQRAYCKILPSRMEGLPTVALEALASGTPVIATDVIGNRDVIIDEENGLLVGDNINSLVDGILRIHQDSELRDKLSLNARSSVVPDYTWDTIGKQAEEIFTSV